MAYAIVKFWPLKYSVSLEEVNILGLPRGARLCLPRFHCALRVLKHVMRSSVIV